MKVRLKYFFSYDIFQIKMIIKIMIIGMIFETIDEIPYLSFYLFNIKIYRKKYKYKRRKYSVINILQIVNTTNERTEVSYGFNNPSATGLMYGVLSTLSNIEQYPDFLPQNNYVIINGVTSIYVWTTLMNYLKFKRKIEV